MMQFKFEEQRIRLKAAKGEKQPLSALDVLDHSGHAAQHLRDQHGDHYRYGQSRLAANRANTRRGPLLDRCCRAADLAGTRQDESRL